MKHTPSDHADHEPLQAAVQVMRDVASSINERKRKFENLTSLAEWQLNIDSWQVRIACSLILRPWPNDQTFLVKLMRNG